MIRKKMTPENPAKLPKTGEHEQDVRQFFCCLAGQSVSLTDVPIAFAMSDFSVAMVVASTFVAFNATRTVAVNHGGEGGDYGGESDKHEQGVEFEFHFLFLIWGGVGVSVAHFDFGETKVSLRTDIIFYLYLIFSPYKIYLALGANFHSCAGQNLLSASCILKSQQELARSLARMPKTRESYSGGLYAIGV